MAKRIGVHLTRRVQVVQFQPIEYGVSLEDDVEDGETPEAARVRLHAEVRQMLHDVEADFLAAASEAFEDGSPVPVPLPETKNRSTPPRR